MPPARTSLLGEALALWQRKGWPLEDLKQFRMGPDDDALDTLDEQEVEALQTLSADDVKALTALTPEQRAELVTDDGPDPRIKQARDESAARRRELKPWKDLGKELGLTPDQIREALKAAGKAKPDTDDKAKPDPPDADAIARKAALDAEAKANRRVVRAEVKVLARDLFAAPDDAPLYIDLDRYEVDDDGELVDPDELIEDLKRVLKSKPHLAKKPGKPKPDKAQGQRGTPVTGADAGRAEAERRFGKKTAEAK